MFIYLESHRNIVVKWNVKLIVGEKKDSDLVKRAVIFLERKQAIENQKRAEEQNEERTRKEEQREQKFKEWIMREMKNVMEQNEDESIKRQSRSLELQLKGN